MIEGQICLRNGEMRATLEFGPVRITMGITELRHLLACAGMDVRNASPAARSILQVPISILQDAVDRAICEAPRSDTPDEDEAENLARWQATGPGGVTDLEAVKQWIKMSDTRARHDSRIP